MTLPRQTLQQYEKSLRLILQELEHGLAKTVEEALSSAPEGAQDIADQAVSAYHKEMLFTEGNNHHLQLSQVRRALDRLADGSYGSCLHCGSAIGVKRLAALPWTPYCIACQDRLEKGEIQEVVDVE